MISLKTRTVSACSRLGRQAESSNVGSRFFISALVWTLPFEQQEPRRREWQVRIFCHIIQTIRKRRAKNVTGDFPVKRPHSPPILGSKTVPNYFLGWTVFVLPLL